MRVGRRTRLLALFGLIVFAILLLVLWIGNRSAVIHEKASPDQFDLGSVAAGSQIEVSARLLTSANKHPFDVAFEWCVKRMPGGWQSSLRKWNPKRFRKKAPQVDCSLLKPSIELPPFVHLEEIAPEQRKEWYDNRPFFVLFLKIDASRPGDYSGSVKLRLDQREASLPIRLCVKQSERPFRLLVVETLYSSDTTESGVDLYPATMVLKSLNPQLDCLRNLPSELTPYQTILLAEGALVHLGDAEVSRLKAFLEKGGRLVIAADAFFVGTVPKANEIIADYGLQIVNKDYAQTVTVTNVVQDVLTKSVGRLEFWRPALIQITDPSKGKIIAPAPSLDGGFVAVSRLANGGEIIVLTQSLWWHRLDSAKGGTDNSRLLRNMLDPESH